MATPWSALLSTSLTLSARKEPTVCPVLVVSSSVPVRVGVVGVNTGASLTAVTLIATGSVSVRGPPVPVAPPSLVVTVSVSEPVKSCTP